MSADDIIRIAVIDDDRIVCDGMRMLVGGASGYACTGTYGSVEEALERMRVSPDVLLLDVHLPGIDGDEGVLRLRAKFPGIVIVMMTAIADDGPVFRSICNGACGYVLKKTPPAKLLEAIREAKCGGVPMSPEIARKVVDLFRKVAPPAREDHGLTPQELRLLSLLVQGHSYKTAARELTISINTIRNHIRSIYEKLQVHSKSEAVGKALRAGIV